jgi:uncharacterized ParB-like nuclease family protein
MTDSIEITLSGIAVPLERLRALRPDNVDAIAESMNAVGQLQDVLLRDRPGGGYWLVAGRHRLEAVRKLKWETVRCTILEDVSADEAELIEIDENLIRAELTPAEQAMHITRRKELYEKLHPETRHGGDRRSTSQKENLKTFVINTARKTRRGRSTVAKAATRGKKVKVLADIAGTSLDKGTELDALGKLSEAEQKKLAERAKAGENVSAMKPVEATVRAKTAAGAVILMFTPKADGVPGAVDDDVDAEDGSDDDVDLNDHRVGANVVYASISNIEMAKTTPEVFWAVFGSVNSKPSAEKWLNAAIRTLRAIKKGMPK